MPEATNPHDPALPWFPCEPLADEAFTTAPVRFTFERRLPVSADRLFDIFEDPTSWPVWARGIGSVIWTSPKPYGLGTTRTVVFWGGMRVYEVFTAWERGRRMQFQFEGTSELVWRSFGERYEVTPDGDAACTLRWTVAYQPTGVFATLHPVIGPIMKLNLGSYMGALERYCRRAG